MTIKALSTLLKHDDIDIVIDRRHQKIWLEGTSSFANEKLTKVLNSFTPDDRYNNGG